MRAGIMVVLSCLLLAMLGCSAVEDEARNTAAALSGSIVAAQAKYQSTCAANPSQEICRVINRGVSGENALITAIETYCGWAQTSATNPGAAGASLAPPDPSTKCVPVRSAEAALRAAIANATQLTTQIKGAL